MIQHSDVSTQNSKLQALIQKLIHDGTKLFDSRTSRKSGPDQVDDTRALKRWANELILFKLVAGPIIEEWHEQFDFDGDVEFAHYLHAPIAALETIRYALDNRLLVRFEDLVIADVFSDLRSQADYLLSQNFFLAAGVILRAVLEEQLRKMCVKASCLPAKAKPTISDLNQSLYTSNVYGKTMMHHVTAIAAVGNDAAHNNPSLRKEDVEGFARGLEEFLARFAP